MCVTLNDGYLRYANRGSSNYTDSQSKYNISSFNEKSNFLVYFLLFYCFFLRLQIYKAIAALPAMF